MSKLDGFRNRVHDVFWGAGVAEIATAVFVHEEQLTLAGLGLVVAAEIIERKKNEQPK